MASAEEAAEQPWEQAGQVRRDAEPHRGPLLLRLGTASLISGPLTICLLLPGVVGLPFTLVILFATRQDMEKMRIGLMDPRGIEQGQRAG